MKQSIAQLFLLSVRYKNIMLELEKLTRNSREGTNFTCPIDPQALIDLQNKYGNYSKWIINKDGVRN